MDYCFKILSSLLLIATGVFGVEIEEVSVTEGDPVTLQAGVEKQKNDLFVWYFGPENTLVARINGKEDTSKIYDIYLERVKVDYETGSLTITNIKTTDAGLYNLRINSKNQISYKKYRVTVYDRLPIPVIQISSYRSYRCDLLCSVFNVSHVTLSWYKGHSLLSSISVSDLSFNVSLPLELENEEKNSYSCVVENNISKQTKHLDISDLCTNSSFERSRLVLITVTICAGVLLIISAVLTVMCIRKQRGGYLKGNLVKTGNAESFITSKGDKIFRNKSEDANTSPALYPYV